MTDISIETDAPEGSGEIIDAAVGAALRNRDRDGLISVTLTDDEAIRRINREYRHIDRPTDVLSFPYGEGEEIAAPPDGFLGDIVISVPRTAAQAAEYGHSYRRELSFLALHGALHLMGYDHGDEAAAREMFALQDIILKEMGITE